MMWISHECNTPGPTDRLGISSISQGNPWESQPGLKGRLGNHKRQGLYAHRRVDKVLEFITKLVSTTGRKQFNNPKHSEITTWQHP